jgi:hypothetical protein
VGNTPLRGLLALLLIVVLGATVRVQGALRDPHFDRQDPSGMLVTDPGLLFYLTRRTVEAGGLPADLRADPRLEYPNSVDVLARFTYGQELLVLGAHKLIGERLPLHVLCLWVFAILGALVALPIYGLALELTGRHGWAAGAAGCYALLAANYRTLGFVLMREDLALPLFALHLYLAARAVRLRRVRDGLLAGLVLGAALGSWHAMGMVVLLEALALLVLFVRRGETPLVHPSGVAALLALGLCALLIPALRAKGAILSPALALLWSMALVGWLRRRRPRIAWAGGAVLLGLLVALGSWVGTPGDLGHVAGVMWAKVGHLGVRPTDPNLIPFEARMMWQGPFDTLNLSGAWDGFGMLLVALVVVAVHGVWRLARGAGDGLELVLGAGLVLSVMAACLVSRMVVLPGLLLPALLVRAAQRSSGSRETIFPQLGMLGLGFLQLLSFGSWYSRGRTWYEHLDPPAIAAAVRAVGEHTPEGAAVVSDFMLSTALLASEGRPLVLSPKWESRSSRERVERFWHALYWQSPASLRALITQEWSTHWLLIDRETLWLNPDARYLAGLGPDVNELPAGTAAAALLGRSPGQPPTGYRRVWSGPDPVHPRFSLYSLE